YGDLLWGSLGGFRGGFLSRGASSGRHSITTRARTGTQSSHPTALKLSSYSEYRHSERSLGCFSRNRDRCFSHHDTSRPSGTTTSSPRRGRRRRDAARNFSTLGVRRRRSRRRSPARSTRREPPGRACLCPGGPAISEPTL